MKPTAGQIREGVTFGLVVAAVCFVGPKLLVEILMAVHSAIAFVIPADSPLYRHAVGYFAFGGFLGANVVIAAVVQRMVNLVSCACHPTQSGR